MSIKFEVPPFPTEMFSAHIRNLIKEGSKSLLCPEDFFGTAILAVMSSAIGNARVIRVKKGWTEPAVLFTGVIAPPSSKKSPAFKIVFKPVFEKQKEMKLKYEDIKERYNIELQRWESDKKNNVKPEKPTLRRNYLSDFTIEALSKKLHANPKGVLVGLDELSAWIKSMDQYRGGKGSDKQKWLSIWSTIPMVIDRSSYDDEEPIIVERPIVNVTGGIQPDLLKFLKSAENDGFIQRILLSFPERNVDYHWVEEGIPDEVMQNYGKRYNELYDLKPLGNDDGSTSPMILDFTPQAKKYWIKFYNANANDIKFEANAQLNAAFGKIEGYTARLALVVQLMFAPDSRSIDKEAVEVAVVLANYFKAHARKVYAHIKNSKVDMKMHTAIERIKSNGGSMTIREVYTKKIAKCTNKKSAMVLIRALEEAGYGRIEKKQANTGGSATIVFHLLPNVSAISNHERFL